uniref:Mitochondrial resolvase Ydc2 catalytic domain-containing protein n=1 Tax=viral metagenome TaxID=1070528 RepID=A0A6C0IY50_9ZZZZ
MSKKILSIDVGIKNLAYCILEKKDDKFNICNWDIVNILDEKLENQPKCQNILKNKICSKIASYSLNTEPLVYYCDKKTCEKNINQKYPKCKSKKLKKITSKNTSILELGSILLRKLDKKKEVLLDVDEVVIENQPVLKNPTMKSIQIILYTYFIEHGYNIDGRIKNIVLFSARNKLKLYDGPKVECQKKNDYDKRKFLSVEYTKYYIKDDLKNNNFFLKHKKKDDLADSFIQGYYYLFKDK